VKYTIAYKWLAAVCSSKVKKKISNFEAEKRYLTDPNSDSWEVILWRA
jgi:hypothetical protein